MFVDGHKWPPQAGERFVSEPWSLHAHTLGLIDPSCDAGVAS